MGCTNGHTRFHEGEWQKCIGEQWVIMPMPPPSVRREVTDLGLLASDAELQEAVDSEDQRVIISIEPVEPSDG